MDRHGGYTYTWPSRTAHASIGTYPVTATDHWTVTWVASGVAAGSGSIALRSTGTSVLPVGELQAVRTR